MQTKYFIKNKTIPQAIHKLQRLERLLTSTRIDDEIEGKTSTLQKSLIKRISMQKQFIDDWQRKHDEIVEFDKKRKEANNTC